MRQQLKNAYDRLEKMSAQVWNSRALFIASIALTTLSAIATAYVNAMVHRKVIGLWPAIGIAVLIFFVAEGTLLIANHGLLNVYTNNRQRFWATIAYWAIKIAMWLNIAILCCRLGEVPLPYWLAFWNKWSIALHAGIGLILIDLIRNSDSVKQFKMAQLRAATAEQDALTARMLKSYSSWLIWASALRGTIDGLSGALKILWISSGFPKQIAERIQNVMDGPQQNVRLVGPATAQAPLRTSAPPAPLASGAGPKPSPKQKGKPSPEARKSPSGSGSSLPAVEHMEWENHTEGGKEAWHVPPGAVNRGDKTYLGYVGKRLLATWGSLDPDARQKAVEEWLEAKRAKKGIQ